MKKKDSHIFQASAKLFIDFCTVSIEKVGGKSGNRNEAKMGW